MPLKITDIYESAVLRGSIKIVAYVPIRFRSGSEVVPGARHIQLGDFKTELLELQFPSSSLILSGLSLVLASTSMHKPFVGSWPSIVGLPIVSLSDDQVLSGNGSQRLDIRTTVQLSCIDTRAEVSLGGAEVFDSKIVFERLQFFLFESSLVGI